jgi:hypothetical protein
LIHLAPVGGAATGLAWCAGCPGPTLALTVVGPPADNRRLFRPELAATNNFE